jgi:hypothetical protein
MLRASNTAPGHLPAKTGYLQRPRIYHIETENKNKNKNKNKNTTLSISHLSY